MIYGYGRISDKSQNISRQINSLKKIGCEKIFTDEQSGKDDNRPAFQELLNTVKKGDVIYIHSLDRFMRSTKHLLLTVEKLTENGVLLKSIEDKWLDTSEENPFSQTLMTIVSALAEYERKIMKIRQREGIEAAKKNGIHLGRPSKEKAREKKMEQMMADIVENKRTVKEASELYGIPVATYYRYKNVRMIK